MDKEKILDLMMLLSAIESWSFSTTRLPDYIHERIDDSIDFLREQLLSEDK